MPTIKPLNLKILLLAFVACLFFTLAEKAQAATYYVAPNGNDNNPGTLAQPWATLNKANSMILAGTSRSAMGDMVIIRGGNYHQTAIITKPWTTWRAQSGETPIFDGQWTIPPLGSYQALIKISVSGVVLDGVEIRNSQDRGLVVAGENGTISNGVAITTIADVIVKNVKVIHTMFESIVTYFAENTLYEDCEIAQGNRNISQYCHYDLQYCRSIPHTSGGDDGSMAPNPSSNNTTYRRCIFRDAYGEGLNIERYSSGSTVEYCQIYGNGKYQLYVVSNRNTTVRHNLIYGTNMNANGRVANQGDGIWLSAETQWNSISSYGGHKIYGNFVANNGANFSLDAQEDSLNMPTVDNCEIYNNTFLHPSGNWNVSVYADDGNGHIFKNNIVAGSGASGLVYAPSGVIARSNNIFSSAQNNIDDDIEGAGDIYAAVPTFAKTTGWNSLSGGGLSFNDFKLQAGSPGINAGTALGAPYNSDYFGTARPQGSAWDIGAHEYITGGGDTTAPAVPSGVSVR